MKKTKKINSIKDALIDGFKLHGFTSGGRLRVLSLTKDKKEFYGQGVDFYEALRILGDDVKAGGRKYKDVYGDGKIEVHYLTGRYPDADDAVDTWFYKGYGFDAIYEDGKVVVTLTEKRLERTPSVITNLVFDQGKTVKWKYKEKDTIYTSEPSKFPNGDPSCTTSASPAEGAWFHEMKYEGRADDFSVAMTNAFAKTNTSPEFIILN